MGSGGLGTRFSFAGAQGDGQADPEPPSLDLPRVQTDMERPERDQERRNLQTLVQGLGALGAIGGAASDSNLLTAVGAGLTQGASQAQRQSEEQFQQRLSTYEDFLRDAQETNREFRRLEQESQFQADMAQYEDQQARDRIRLEDELDQPSESEQALNRAREESYEALTEQRRTAAEENQAQAERIRRDPGSSADTDLPASPDEVERELTTVDRQIQALQSRYQDVPTNIYGEPDRVRQRQIGQQIDTLIKRREALKTRQAQLQRQRNGAGQGTAPSNIPEEDLTENRDTFMNQPAPTQGAAAPGTNGRAGQQQTTPSAPADTAASGQDTRQRPRDASGQVSSQLRRRIQQMAPSGADTTRLFNAAALVQSDTTDFTPQQFEAAYGFNPFQ